MRLTSVCGVLAVLLMSTVGLNCVDGRAALPMFAPSVNGGQSDFPVREGDVAVVIQAPSGFGIAGDGRFPKPGPQEYIASVGETYALGLVYGERTVYMILKVYTTTDFTDSSKVTISVDQDMIKKVLAGDSQILRVNDPQVKVTVLEARIGNRAPYGFSLASDEERESGFGE